MRDRADGSPGLGDAGSPGRWRWARAVGVLLRFGFRADPRLVAGFYAVVAVWQVATLGGVYATKLIVDAAVRADQRGAAFAAAAFGVAAVASSLCARTHLKIAFRLQEKVNQLIDRELMALIGGIPGLEHHEHPRFHDEVSLVRSQQYLLSRMTHAVVQNFRYWLQLFGTAALLAHLDPLLLALPLFGAGSLLAGRRGQEWETGAQEATAERRRLRRHLFDLATGAAAGKELRVFDAAGWIIARYEALSTEVDGEISRVARKRALLDAVGSLCFAAGYAGAIGLVLLRAIAGAASPGDVVLAFSLASQMTGTVGGIVGVVNFLRNATRAATRYLWLADYAERARRPAPDPAPVPARLQDGITLEGVTFAYPQTDGVVLRDVSVHFPAGSVVALVGENGAGKTTLVKLLCRFYEPTAGRILVDRVDLRRFDVTEWRRRMSAGFQDFSRFEFTLRDIVGVGDLARRSDLPALEHALARSGADGMAATLPGGWDTQLGTAWPGGIELSGGQWQKLALARALLRADPLLVVFDEPTAALDAPTEHALFERLAEAARSGASAGTVTLIVSHRFSTVRMADFIIVLDRGRVVETGSHAELIARGGQYAELFELQARSYR